MRDPRTNITTPTSDAQCTTEPPTPGTRLDHLDRSSSHSSVIPARHSRRSSQQLPQVTSDRSYRLPNHALYAVPGNERCLPDHLYSCLPGNGTTSTVVSPETGPPLQLSPRKRDHLTVVSTVVSPETGPPLQLSPRKRDHLYSCLPGNGTTSTVVSPETGPPLQLSPRKRDHLYSCLETTVEVSRAKSGIAICQN